jgi:small-conductance mechanosensitive channel
MDGNMTEVVPEAITGDFGLILAGNLINDWLIALCIVVGTYIIMMMFRRLVRRLLEKIEHKRCTFTLHFIAETIGRSGGIFFAVVAMSIGSHYLEFAENVRLVFDHLLIVAIILQLARWLSSLVTLIIIKQRQSAMDGNSENVTRLPLRFVGMLTKTGLWMIAIGLCLDVLGYDLSRIVTGLGISGIVVALAAQNIVADLFATFTIFVDRPFVVGELITVDDMTGKIERIGLKTTRIRSLSGEQILVGNQDLLKSRLRNFARLSERRILFRLRIEYGTSPALLARLPSLVKEIVDEQELTRYDRGHFVDFGEFSLEFEFAYYVESPDLITVMNVREKVNLEICQRFKENGILFAFPKRVLIQHDEDIVSGAVTKAKKARKPVKKSKSSVTRKI